jgi:hypothetical protein
MFLEINMDDNQLENTPHDEVPSSDKNKMQKVYHKPLLEKLGDLRGLTLGGSPFGPGDTGEGDNYYPL